MSLRLQLPVETLSQQIRAACILECTAPKPGNVFPGRNFTDVTDCDFRRSADAIAPILADAASLGVGRAIRDAVVATRQAVGSNTNLGMILLLAPLAAVPPHLSCSEGIEDVLDGIDIPQTALIFEAIRLAQPGGLGKAYSNDVATTPDAPIIDVMALAPHDRIAWQYTHRFDDVLGWGRHRFLNALQHGLSWSDALVRVHVEFIARQSDSLILRKLGERLAAEAQHRASKLLSLWDEKSSPPNEIREFDAWLREDGNRRNPGTTADLLAAMLFALIRDGLWHPPEEISISSNPATPGSF